MYKVDFHIHTHHSYDSRMDPEKILEVASKRGLDAVCISDHDTIKGGVECSRLSGKYNIDVIVSSEIKTNYGDITGLFLKEEIHHRNFNDVVTAIKNQGGKVLLVHPYVQHNLSEINFDAIDMVEVFNARTSPVLNRKAEELATLHNKIKVAGSDAHLYAEIANAYTCFENSNMERVIQQVTKRNRIIDMPASQFIKANKSGSLKAYLKWATWVPKYVYTRLKEKP